MMNNIYNSYAEIKPRVLMILSLCEDIWIDADKIVALDFITTYSKEFGFFDKNLHGDSFYKYSELANRKESIYNAVRNLVLERMIDYNLSSGFKYKINVQGLDFIKMINCEYSINYRCIATVIVNQFGDKPSSVLIKKIQEKSFENSKEVNNANN